MTKCIYVVEDEPDMLDFFRYILTEEGYNVECFSSGEAVLKKIQDRKPNLFLFDLMLPGISGFELCRILKNDSTLWEIPIIVISSRNEEFDVVTGINLGCDDYTTKPFSEKILLAKIKSLINKRERQSNENTEVIKFKDLVITPAKFEISIKGKIINLTPAEFKLLAFLITNKDIVYTRERIIDRIYDYEGYSGDRSIDILIGRIRKKIGIYGKNIESIYGVGYRFKEDIEDINE